MKQLYLSFKLTLVELIYIPKHEQILQLSILHSCCFVWSSFQILSMKSSQVGFRVMLVSLSVGVLAVLDGSES